MRWKHQFGDGAEGKTVLAGDDLCPPQLITLLMEFCSRTDHEGRVWNGWLQRCNTCKSPCYGHQPRGTCPHRLDLWFPHPADGRCLQWSWLQSRSINTWIQKATQGSRSQILFFKKRCLQVRQSLQPSSNSENPHQASYPSKPQMRFISSEKGPTKAILPKSVRLSE